MKVNILLSHRIGLMRAGLHALLHRNNGFHVVAEADNVEKTIDLAKQFMPDVLIVDLAFPGQQGVGPIRKIKKELPDIKIIALIATEHEQQVPEALKAGASAALLDDSLPDELCQALDAVMNNQSYLSPHLAHLLINHFTNGDAQVDRNLVSLLTSRQKQVLKLVSEGMNTKQIASKLSISPKTVDAHRLDLMDKLKIRSVAELTKLAIREGLTTLEV